MTQTSKALERTFRAELLTLVTDLEGSSEVGGLFLHPGERAGGLGMLLARSRYLFIRLHRRRFADRLIAELRGVIDEAGGSPFWDGLAGKFFDMNFQTADELNATHGNQFIADLMPKTPIYTALLPDTARAVIAVPHPTGRAAMRMLEREGFKYERHVDIFDGGPTMEAPTDEVRTVRDAKMLSASDVVPGGKPAMLAAGELKGFVACYGLAGTARNGAATIDPNAADLLNLRAGQSFLRMER